MPNLSREMMFRFLAEIEQSKDDWQVRQAAGDALRIYTENDLKAVHCIDILKRSPDRKVPTEAGGLAAGPLNSAATVHPAATVLVNPP